MTISQYISTINCRYQLGNTTEHSFRGDLQQLIECLANVQVINEPKRQACGAPDYILTDQGNIPIGFIEAKNIGASDMEGKKKSGNKEQFDRYKAALDNLIFTDYLCFDRYHSGELISQIAIGEVTSKGIRPLEENFSAFKDLIKGFCVFVSQTITSPKELAAMMAGKARLLANILERALISDEENTENSTLVEHLEAFRKILIHDITARQFADVYAQTIAYGMFAARVHDLNLGAFSRQKAAELIPKSNPFLRKLFGYIAGPDIDERIVWVVDSLAAVFLSCDLMEILQNYGRTTDTENPVIHFYETFLSEYDPALRKARGVWYTPAPVVNFIVRAVDDILKTEFDLPQGLADRSKTKIKVKKDSQEIEQEVHKVQILDPATGTGTFLAEVIKQINKKIIEQNQKGIWNSYVEKHLLPRLNGFELLMASYAMAHLQLDLLLKETGFKNTKKQRAQVYLTNSLEEYHSDTKTLFAEWLSNEANEANQIKRETPVMCVIGNPPYSGESANKGSWIKNLMQAYKKEPGGKERLNERNSKWINDDYVKFMRYGQHFIEKNGSGILAFINPHGFLDNPTFRGMRWNLLKTYDKIYTIDLHGNAKKKETAPDGSPDQNVFDIMQGVSINIFVKTGEKNLDELGKVFHYDLYGKRNFKYDFLLENNLKSVDFQELPNLAPNYFFVPKNFKIQKTYDKGFSVKELFTVNNVGIVTARDNFTIHESKEDVKKTINEFLSLEDEEARIRFKLGKDVRDWQVHFARKDLQNHYPKKGNLTKIAYRPFDDKWTFFTGKSKGFHCYPRTETMQHFLKGENIGLALCKQFKSGDRYRHVFVAKLCMESSYVSNNTSEITSIFPLYLYPENGSLNGNGHNINGNGHHAERIPNLNSEVVAQIEKSLGLDFCPEKKDTECFAPIDLLDYIYAILYSPSYRETYQEFLKIDFPHVPYPEGKKQFWQLVALGGELRQLHLLESPKVELCITSYPKDGDNIVSRKIVKKDWELYDKNNGLGRVWINDQQYFEGIPLVAWEFHVGGYQPAQKWLKDRSGRTTRSGRKLDFGDILHYQKIIVALTETATIMRQIDAVLISCERKI